MPITFSHRSRRPITSPRNQVLFVVSAILLTQTISCRTVAPLPTPPPNATVWSFDDTKVGMLPKGYRPVLGNWGVAADSGAQTAPNVLRLSAKLSEKEYTRLLIENERYRDLHMQSMIRLDSGNIDQAAGLMFRVQDDKNYYLVRANALEANVRLYRVVDGDRQRLDNLSRIELNSGVWYSLAVDVRGDQIEVYFNQEKIFSVIDSAYREGALGLWGKADSVSTFDNVAVWKL